MGPNRLRFSGGSTSVERSLLSCFLRVTKLAGDELEHRVGERDDIGSTMATVPQLTVDRLGKNTNSTAVGGRSVRAMISRCPHPGRRMMHFACHPKKPAKRRAFELVFTREFTSEGRFCHS